MSETREVKRVVIAGGGTAGWLAAAALSHQLGRLLDITLVESDEIGTIGVGEATIPPIRGFHKLLQIDEREFMRATAATFKLGISFENWAPQGRSLHPSVRPQRQADLDVRVPPFLAAQPASSACKSELGDYCFELEAARAGQVRHCRRRSEINYAYHFDAGLYARFLRAFSERYGIKRVEGKIKEVQQHAETRLHRSAGAAVGPRRRRRPVHRLHRLSRPADRADAEDRIRGLVALAAVRQRRGGADRARPAPAPPYTRAIAHEAGWRWRIPLQHRVGNGLVFSSRHLTDDDAKQELLAAIDGKPITAPRVLNSSTGRRRKAWNKNVRGARSGQRFHRAARIDQHPPHDGRRDAPDAPVSVQRRQRFARSSNTTRSRASRWRRRATSSCCTTTPRSATTRRSGRYCRDMPIPDSLAHRIELFKENALCVPGRRRTFPGGLVDAGDAGSAHRAAVVSSGRPDHAGPGAPQGARGFPDVNRAGGRKPARAPGLRGRILSGGRQRVALTRAARAFKRAATGGMERAL